MVPTLMTPDRIQAIYLELDRARVILPTAGQPGPHLLLEKLRECRTWQDRVITLSVEIMQAISKAKQAHRAAKAVLQLSKGTANYAALQSDAFAIEDQLDDLRAIEQAVRVTRNNLKATDSDIRLASHLLDLQIKLGDVQPPTPAPGASSLHAAGVSDDTVAQMFAPPVQAATPPAPPAAAPPLSYTMPAVTPPGPPAAHPPHLQQPTVDIEILDIEKFFSESSR